MNLKTTKAACQDAGQMGMHAKMYDERFRSGGDNPTIGIPLCTDTDEEVTRYSSLHDNERFSMAKYLTNMSAQEQLRHKIEQQKTVFALKQSR